MEIHLPGVFMFEGADFQIDQDMATRHPVVKNEIDPMMAVSGGDTELPGLETKAISQLKEEALQMIQQRGFKIILRIAGTIRQPGEFQDVGIADESFDSLLRFLVSGRFDDGLFIGGESGAFVKQGFNLPLELTHGPLAFQAFVFVESTFPRIFDAEEFLKFGPRNS